MKRLIGISLFITGVLWAKPITWNRNIEYIMGFYDVGLSTSFTICDLSSLSWQLPTIRWNPFAFVATFETTVRYFPLSQFEIAFWVFGKEAINPYLFTGINVPHTFQALDVPLGVGLVYSWGSFSLHGRVYENFVVTPVLSKDLSFEVAGSLRL